ncbi:MAG: NUDIX domain-containing protein [Bacteroidetes bacterium]|nr:NUDIX domain-containing protein [Bacteroidota bacterium]
MDEYIDIVTETGKPTGKTCLKSKAHKKGYYHNTAHIWLYTKKGEILLSQRSATKVIYPLLWDVSVAGHVDAQETIEQAAIRETLEEINLSLTEKDLQKIGVFECFQTYKNGIVDNEFHHTFITELKVDITELIPQKDEVEAFKLVTIEDFKSKLKQSGTNKHFIPTNTSYYEFVIDKITNAI